MRRKIWMRNPHGGGTTIPNVVQQETVRRIRAYAEKRYAGTFVRLDIRFRGAFCYIDAYVEPSTPSRRLLRVLHETRQGYLDRLREVPLHLSRLRYFGGTKIWSMAFYTYSNERYEPCTFPNGTFYGTLEEAFEAGAAYLQTRGARPAAEHERSPTSRNDKRGSDAAGRAKPDLVP